jgi:hypothetical protein
VKLVPILMSTAIVGVLMLGTAAASHAGTPTETTPFGHGAPANAPDPTLEKLEALVGTQTKTEISAILGSCRPVEALFDTDVGEYVAAFTKPINLQMALSVVGSRCDITSAYAQASGSTDTRQAQRSSMG